MSDVLFKIFIAHKIVPFKTSIIIEKWILNLEFSFFLHAFVNKTCDRACH